MLTGHESDVVDLLCLMSMYNNVNNLLMVT